MPINWNFDGSKYSKEDDKLIPEGLYRVRITKAEEAYSKSNGNQMIVMTLEVSGYEGYLPFPLQSWMTFDSKKQDWTNQQLGRIFDSFKIQQGDLDPAHWIGKDGGAEIIIEEYKKEPTDKLRKRNKVTKFIPREQVDVLPAWEEKNSGGVINSEMVDLDGVSNADTLPF